MQNRRNMRGVIDPITLGFVIALAGALLTAGVGGKQESRLDGGIATAPEAKATQATAHLN